MRWLVAGLLLAQAACMRSQPDGSRDAQGDTAAAAPQLGSPQTIECEGLERTILRTAAERTPMRNMFGAPDSVRSITEPNRHIPGVIDSLFDLFYPGLTAHIRKPYRGNDMAVHVQLSDNRYLRYPQIGIGASPDALIRSLGEPTAREPGSFVYACSEEIEEPVIFHLDAGGRRVSSVEIQYYVD